MPVYVPINRAVTALETTGHLITSRAGGDVDERDISVPGFQGSARERGTGAGLWMRDKRA